MGAITIHQPNALTEAEEMARQELLRRLAPEIVRLDEVNRGIYGTDASLYQMIPVAVVTPRTQDDVAVMLAVSRELGVPVMPRGGGTSLAGQTVNRAIVMDFSMHMNGVLQVNAEERWCRAQPGLVRDELNVALAPHGLEFAPETSTSNRANIGGMIGNNSSGMRSVMYGRTSEHVLELKVMLWDGTVVDLKPRRRYEIDRLRQDPRNAEGRLWDVICKILEEHRGLIEARFPKVIRRVGGYSLDFFPEDAPEWNLAKLLCGSEGTLGVLLEAKLKLVVPPKHIGIMAIHFMDEYESLRSVPPILHHKPLSVEYIDRTVVQLARTNPGAVEHCWFIEGDPNAIIAVELVGESEEDVKARLAKLEADMAGRGYGYARPVMLSEKDRGDVVELRKKGLGILLSVRGDIKPQQFIEDACVPVEHMAEYVERVTKMIESKGLGVMGFGHASVGVIHIHPYMDMKKPEHIALLDEISRETMEMVKEYGGSWSGEHGDGISRGAQNDAFWGPEMVSVFRALKRAFDPRNLMNPGRLLDTPKLDEALRMGLNYHAELPETYFRFSDYGNFVGAVEMCNGVGACRKTIGGTMCPSYMATREEKHSTRGRANALRLAISNQLPGGLRNDGVGDALDLCLSCKACKTECPSNVDMARMKAEYLAQKHDHEGETLRSRLFAESPWLGRLLTGPLAPLVNAVLQSGFQRWFQSRVLGVAEQRHLPLYATETLGEWFEDRPIPASSMGGRTVVLFADCWTDYHDTHLGKAAVNVLEHLGYHVELVHGECCQRPRISKGFLNDARREGGETMAVLDQYAQRGIPIVALEPSCCSSITDDLPDLVEDQSVGGRVGPVTQMLEDFLGRELEAGRITLQPRNGQRPNVLLHGHCHQKALYGTQNVKRLLKALGANVTEVDSGCCGMAGSFGYEKEHYDVSQACGERRLFPAVRKADAETWIVADGFSCRHQVHDGTGRLPLHAVEALEKLLVGK